jgi:hypothetical protein
MEITGYQGGVGVEPIIENGGSEWRLIYNDTASAFSNGIPYALTMTVASGVPYWTVTAPKANAVGARIVVIDNSPLSLATIPAYNWGYVLVSGLSVQAVTSSTIAANDQLTVAADGVAFTAISTGVTVGGAVLDTGCCAIAVVNVTTNVWKVALLKRKAVVT